MRFILASASPRRRELLERMGAAPEACPVDVDESLGRDERPDAAVERLARLKAEAALRRLGTPAEPTLILSADTLVVLEGRILAKPGDDAEAREMLGTLSGRTHEVLTGVWLAHADPDGSVRVAGGHGRTRVRFRTLDSETIAAYVRTGEPMDKAGAYGVQELGAILVAGIEGSWSNVVGLPLERLPDWIAELDLSPAVAIPWLARG